jgi:hypothetical protein
MIFTPFAAPHHDGVVFSLELHIDELLVAISAALAYGAGVCLLFVRAHPFHIIDLAFFTREPAPAPPSPPLPS